MITLNTSYPNFKSIPGLILVDCSPEVPRRPTTAAGRHLQYRYGVCSQLADLIAVMAGLTGGQS
jgi:hypothetical protein